MLVSSMNSAILISRVTTEPRYLGALDQAYIVALGEIPDKLCETIDCILQRNRLEQSSTNGSQIINGVIVSIKKAKLKEPLTLFNILKKVPGLPLKDVSTPLHKHLNGDSLPF